MMLDIGDIGLAYDTHGSGEPLLWLGGGMGHGPDWHYVFENAPAGSQLDMLVAQTRAMADGDDPNVTNEQLATIVADTLIVSGDRDFLYPVSLALELRQAIPRSWLWVVPA
jgi:hypothetical protein